MLINDFMHLFIEITSVLEDLNAKHCGNVCVVRTRFPVAKLTAVHTEMTGTQRAWRDDSACTVLREDQLSLFSRTLVGCLKKCL